MSKKLIETIRERLIRLAKTGHLRSQVLLKVFEMSVLPKATLLDVYMQNANFFCPVLCHIQRRAICEPEYLGHACITGG